MSEQMDADAMPLSLAVDPAARAALNGIPAIDFRKNFAVATAAGRGMPGMLRDVVALRFGPGRLTSNEYYYYRLWEPGISDDAKRSFVGKLAQQAMHLACNKTEWQAVAADKLLFHSVIAGAGLPLPELMAVVHRSRTLPGIPALATADDVARFCAGGRTTRFSRSRSMANTASLSVSADRVDAPSDTIALRGSPGHSTVDGAARALAAGETGFLIQRRLDPAPGNC